MDPAVDVAQAARTVGSYSSAESARRYDREAKVMSPRYARAHRVQNTMIAKRLSRDCSGTPTLLDLGCGTASDGADLLKHSKHARYLGIDRASPMANLAAEKLSQLGYCGRFEMMHADLFELARTPSAFVLECRAHNVVAVLISLVLHHYDRAQKQQLYSMIRAILEPGMLLVVTDLFTSSLSDCASDALDLELRGVKSALRRLRSRGETCGDETTVSEYHYRRQNHPATLADEMECLKSSGFSTSDVVYRHGQLAVIAVEG